METEKIVKVTFIHLLSVSRNYKSIFGGVMFRSKFVLLSFVTMLSACATLQPVTGNGKFLQYKIDEVIAFQVDFSTPEYCRLIGEKEKNTNEMLKITCSTESQAQSLPFYFVTTDTITTLKSTLHAKTLDACKSALSTVKENDKESRYERTECR